MSLLIADSFFVYCIKKISKHDFYHILRNASSLPLTYNYQARYERYLLTTYTKYSSGNCFFYCIYRFGKKRAVR